VGLPELAQDARFKSTKDRAAHQLELKELLEAQFQKRPVSFWIETFEQAGVPHARINDYANALADPQVAHMNWLQPITLPGGHATRTFASPVRLDGQGAPVYLNPPGLGEHTQEIKRRYRGA
jgi:crotonobetainyl-CoA:carnitine CoA-transferase CaiB-like acyl-CoA transferase